MIWAAPSISSDKTGVLKKKLENFDRPTSYLELSPKILKIPFGNVFEGFLTLLGLNFWGHFFPQRSCHTAKKTKQNN
jgi:hypothetical protein